MELLAALNVLSLPAGGLPLIAANTFVQLLRALATSARTSPKILIVLLEAGVIDLYTRCSPVFPVRKRRTRKCAERSRARRMAC